MPFFSSPTKIRSKVYNPEIQGDDLETDKYSLIMGVVVIGFIYYIYRRSQVDKKKNLS